MCYSLLGHQTPGGIYLVINDILTLFYMPHIDRLLRATQEKETRRVELVSSRNKPWRRSGHELQRDVAPFHNRNNIVISNSIPTYAQEETRLL